jgi:hypothetical protein
MLYTLELLGMIIHTLKILIDDETEVVTFVTLVLLQVAVGIALLIWGLLCSHNQRSLELSYLPSIYHLVNATKDLTRNTSSKPKTPV